ncbi:putative manganese ion homeostasis (Fr) [Aspergillus ruber CBS 135680]|uniref:Calcineurin-like phosphoesterase domain-containing protein n=1 Tax=Aspergillus ruber (strain CBS 135680) TaxID=1388766 RepID=A0A017S0X2_ASPRC|nr:uncharacterized protein EURHEDRAFT_466705 [Aspergillus ruber CBS 135680]EYE90688.1 hypothetical protein EURHEDRAFT_466705 [Aspergillus ruber CBS 135680]
MSYAYSSAPFRPARRDSISSPSTILVQIQNGLPPWAQQWIAKLRAGPRAGRQTSPREWKAMGRLTIRRVVTIANALILFWVWTLWWGERTVFQESLEGCGWGEWEKWPSHATPHHVAFVADPQLVDPHTYPGRPWPLSTLTVKFTDQYLRRSFSLIQRNFGPDSVLFLGDLFDGGREWATGTTSSPDERYRKYKDSFWKKEYSRFGRIFSDQFKEGDALSRDPLGRRMIASLPGNHDLGFGSGIQIPVRDRFQTFFGKGNRVDVLGNHTFVSVDTVSLSAMDQPDPQTGSTGAGSGDGKSPNEAIWKEAEEFLDQMNVHRAKAETHELKSLRSQTEGYQFNHAAVEINEPSHGQLPQSETVGLPAILLTHVPLYRKAATPCGPYREHYPPSSSDEELQEDEQNSLKIGGGYQYQNVLTQTISNDLVSKVGSNLVHVYSGDDHDYCEVVHREFSGSPKEITVKSLSWAMGVRRPGFVLTSLWNPIDPATGKSLENVSPTLQNHLCLLPDQLSIFIYYGLTLALTLVILLARAVVVTIYPSQSTTADAGPMLPLTEVQRHIPTSSISSSTTFAPRGLASRGSNFNSRSFEYYPEKGRQRSPTKGTYSGQGYGQQPGNGHGKGLVGTVGGKLWGEVWFVAKVVLSWYIFLIWRW